MSKSCFVVMGFGIKNGIDLDITYNKIIKPCITQNILVPFPLYREEKFNGFRCDEISGMSSIDYKFITCLNGADIVIADISTMNANAIYELGARHALKPRSTILLCSKDKYKEFKFFDITYVPIIFYEHGGLSISPNDIATAREQLNKALDFAINSDSKEIDSPIIRVLLESQKNVFATKKSVDNIYNIYTRGKEFLNSNNFDKAEDCFSKLVKINPSEDNLLLYVLAKYKKAEEKQSCKELTECLHIITSEINVQTSTSEALFGRLGAICLRIFNLSQDNTYYYSSLNYYRMGSNFSNKNLYCPRNYCAMLVHICHITEDTHVIKEYFYTAKHYAKLFLNSEMSVLKLENYEEQRYYYYNKIDLMAIVEGGYQDKDKILSLLSKEEITLRQTETIKSGIINLDKSLEKISAIFKDD